MIKTIVGPMFSGKSNILINHYMNIWNKKGVKCFKPIIDTRDDLKIKSRNNEISIPAIGINTFEDLKTHVDSSVKTIFIDEAQFLKGDYNILSEISIRLDIDIYIAGLNMDYKQRPFGVMPAIMAISQEIQNLYAVCFDCNKPAPFVYNAEQTDVINVGDEGYVALCRNCLNKRMEKNEEIVQMKLTKRPKQKVS